MKRVVVTGARGFIARNALIQLEDRFEVSGVAREDPWSDWARALGRADAVLHLAGVNRPENTDQFERDNVELTRRVVDELAKANRGALVVLMSSTQAASDSPYGRSKARAEDLVREYANAGGAGAIFRLPGVFGKWCRPDYNSVVATFCHRVVHGDTLRIDDSTRQVTLTYVDDVINSVAAVLADPPVRGVAASVGVSPMFSVRLGELADQIVSIRDERHHLRIPDLADPFLQRLRATYLSYIPPASASYALAVRRDSRGSLAEFLKSKHVGQIFVSRTEPGITRGGHFHHSKAEKFLVVQGRAMIRLRSVLGGEVVEHDVSGEDYRVVDIPPGYAHSIQNIGPGPLVTLFWASEIFDADRTDTHSCPV